MVNVRLLKSGCPPIAAMIGVRMSATNAVTTAPNAAPITTATARSTTLPRMMNSRKPLSTRPLLYSRVRARRDPAATVASRATGLSSDERDEDKSPVLREPQGLRPVDGDRDHRLVGPGPFRRRPHRQH